MTAEEIFNLTDTDNPPVILLKCDYNFYGLDMARWDAKGGNVCVFAYKRIMNDKELYLETFVINDNGVEFVYDYVIIATES